MCIKRSCSIFAVWLLFMMSGNSALAQVVCGKFDATVTISDHVVSLSLETDLPDDTNISISITRDYYQSGSRESYSEYYFSGTVNAIGVSQVRQVNFQDEVWFNALQKRKDIMARIGGPFREQRIAQYITVQFLVPVNQDNEMFGSRNANLEGCDAKSERPGGLKIIESITRIPLAIKE